MKEFKRVNQNDLMLEFLKYVNENLWVDITKVEIEKYEEDLTLSGKYKTKLMFVKLNNVEYYVNLFYNGYEDKTTFNIYEIIRGDGLIKEIVSKIK